MFISLLISKHILLIQDIISGRSQTSVYTNCRYDMVNVGKVLIHVEEHCELSVQDSQHPTLFQSHVNTVTFVQLLTSLFLALGSYNSLRTGTTLSLMNLQKQMMANLFFKGTWPTQVLYSVWEVPGECARQQ